MSDLFDIDWPFSVDRSDVNSSNSAHVRTLVLKILKSLLSEWTSGVNMFSDNVNATDNRDMGVKMHNYHVPL